MCQERGEGWRFAECAGNELPKETIFRLILSWRTPLRRGMPEDGTENERIIALGEEWSEGILGTRTNSMP